MPIILLALTLFWVFLLLMTGGRFLILLLDANRDSEIVDWILRHSEYWVLWRTREAHSNQRRWLPLWSTSWLGRRSSTLSAARGLGRLGPLGSLRRLVSSKREGQEDALPALR